MLDLDTLASKETYDELKKNAQNIMDNKECKSKQKLLRKQWDYIPNASNPGLDPPLLVLMSGIPLSGKSTMAKYLMDHIQPREKDGFQLKIKIISTD